MTIKVQLPIYRELYETDQQRSLPDNGSIMRIPDNLKTKPSLCEFKHFKVFFFLLFIVVLTQGIINQHKGHNFGSYMIIQTETAGLSPLCPFEHSYSFPFLLSTLDSLTTY